MIIQGVTKCFDIQKYLRDYNPDCAVICCWYFRFWAERGIFLA